MARRGIMIAGLSSASGKTLTCLGLLRACRNQNRDIAAAKTGPDYIDPGFHQAALGKASVNLDMFAMPEQLVRDLASRQAGETLIIEGVMGVHDGGSASSARLAYCLDVPVVLVMDVRSQAETAAAIASGIASSLKSEGVTLAGVILNRCRSARHESMITTAMKAAGITIFGAIPETPDLDVPSRHLGLVQATDLPNLNAVLETAAEIVANHVDLTTLLDSAAILAEAKDHEAMAPPHACIAVARDAAFGFAYPHLLEGWARQGADIRFFSPLANEVPTSDCGFIFLPGGYPELHLDTLAKAEQFMESLRDAAQSQIPIYGECGGYMVLGKAITDSTGQRVNMTGLLDLETSFENPRRQLGYRNMTLLSEAPLPRTSRGHEFHYTHAIHENGQALFTATDKDNTDLGKCGLVSGSVAGSYLHLIAGC